MGTYDTRGGYPISPDEPDTYCSICHHLVESCTCPECSVCGVAGDPDCINIHMKWDQWPHFKEV